MRTIILCILTALAAYSLGWHSHQNINQLHSAGFVTFDPEGYQVERFDEGLYTAFPSYWTTEPKE